MVFPWNKTSQIYLTFTNKNKQFSKRFCQKTENYKNGKARFSIVLTTRKIKSLFRGRVKVNQLTQLCYIYKGNWNCGNNYIDRAIRNLGTRFS